MKSSSESICVSSVFPLQATFLRGAMHEKDFPPEGLPEIAFAGRSNVGKSSLINALLNRKNLAHISKKPGKTAQINFFDIGSRFVLVDMPGYGYAAVSQKMQKVWGTLMPTYFSKREALHHTFVLIDSRHPPQKTDLQIIDFLKHTPRPCTFILTKTDKVSAALLQEHQAILEKLTRGMAVSGFLPFTVKKSETTDQVRQHILNILPS